MTDDPADDNVHLVAEDANDKERLQALRILLKANEPDSYFGIPLEPRVFMNANRLRILRREDEATPICQLTLDALEYYRARRLPIAYHTLILTTTAG